jgi:ATP-dependent DNA helicase RecG
MLVLEYVRDNPGGNIKNMNITLQIPIDTLDKYIKFMVDKKLVEHRGSKKTGGYWILK